MVSKKYNEYGRGHHKKIHKAFQYYPLRALAELRIFFLGIVTIYDVQVPGYDPGYPDQRK